MSQYLVITAIGSDRPGIVNKIVHLVTQGGCNIVDSRIALFGNEFTLIMLLNGNNNNITRVETSLPLLGQEHDLITIMKRTSAHQEISDHYKVEIFVESEDKPGITEQFTQFFADRQIGLSSLSAKTLEMEKSQLDKDLFQISMTARVYPDCNLMQLQEEFNTLCEQLSVSGSLNFVHKSSSNGLV